MVIDINGIGQPFGDDMVKETWDSERGIMLPAYGFQNYEDLFTHQPKNCSKILFGIKANGALNSEMHSNLYSKVYSGSINFLISEQDAKVKLLSTKKGQRLRPEQRIQRLMPHELTSILINEIMNLKQKPTGVNNQIAVEQINKRMGKDKFSALEMAVYRVVQMETEYLSHRRNRGLNRKLSFFRKGGA